MQRVLFKKNTQYKYIPVELIRGLDSFDQNRQVTNIFSKTNPTLDQGYLADQNGRSIDDTATILVVYL